MTPSTWHLPVDGGSIGGVEQAGSDPCLLFIPNAGSPALGWSTLFDQLSDCRAIALDRRGHALSYSAPFEDGNEHWGDVIRVTQGLQLTRPILVGHSTGGFVALCAAAARPDLFSAVVTIETGLLDEPQDVVDQMLEDSYDDEIVTTVAERFSAGRVFHDEREIEDFVAAHRFGASQDWVTADIQQDLSDEIRYTIVKRPDGTWLRTPDVQALRESLNRNSNCRYYPNAELYDLIELPVHVVQTEDGYSVTPPEQVERLTARRPNLRFHDIGGGHFAHYSHAVPLASIIRSVAQETYRPSAA